MSGTVGDRKRLLKVTAGNLRNYHIYVSGHFDFFPPECIGSPRKNRNGKEDANIEILLDGLDQSVLTDIGRDARTGEPRQFFRGRTWVREFFEHHSIKTGDVLALERIDKRKYRLYPFEAKTERQHGWRELIDEPPSGSGPTALELFAGCGGMALGCKRAGNMVVESIHFVNAA